MKEVRKKTVAEKKDLHPRNAHRSRYDFDALIQSCPGLRSFVSVNMYGNESVDFSDPQAVTMLNRALLMHFYGIAKWEIPSGYLCPPVPGRADYIHYIADLLAASNGGVIPRGQLVHILDIGTGANLIYPIIGTHEYGWRFTGTEIDPLAVQSAEKILLQNDSLKSQVGIRLQKSADDIFRGVVSADDLFDCTICNPPFHSSPAEAEAGTLRKLRNLGAEKKGKGVLNFGGKPNELWCSGGETAFVQRMIDQSREISRQCLWFSTLISKKENLAVVYKALKAAAAADVETIDMAQGQKISRIIAWTFMRNDERDQWRKGRI